MERYTRGLVGEEYEEGNDAVAVGTAENTDEQINPPDSSYSKTEAEPQRSSKVSSGIRSMLNTGVRCNKQLLPSHLHTTNYAFNMSN